MIELLLWALPETLVAGFQNKTLEAESVDGEPIILQSPCNLMEKRKLSHGAIVLTESFLYFFMGNELIERHRFKTSDLSHVKVGFLTGFTFRDKAMGVEYKCYVEKPRQWTRNLKKVCRSSRSDQLRSLSLTA